MNQEDQQGQQKSRAEMVRPLSSHRPALIVVTGSMAAGKSTIARLLAQHFVPGVHVEADMLQRMIVSGGQWVSEPGEPSGEAAQQLQLRLKNMCLLKSPASAIVPSRLIQHYDQPIDGWWRCPKGRKIREVFSSTIR